MIKLKVCKILAVTESTSGPDSDSGLMILVELKIFMILILEEYFVINEILYTLILIQTLDANFRLRVTC